MISDLDASYRAAFDRLLVAEGLEDLSQYLKVNSFEEVPLYSRLHRLEFLTGLRPSDQNVLLIRAAVIHLEKIVGYARQSVRSDDEHYLRMVSITGWGDHLDGDLTCSGWTTGPIRPNFWIGNLRNEAMVGFTTQPAETACSQFVADALDNDPDYRLREGRSKQSYGSTLRRVYVQLVDGGPRLS